MSIQDTVGCDAGRRDFLRMVAAGAVGLSGLTAAESAGRGSAVPARKPNILFLMTDQHRADCLGSSGNPIIHTPNLDRIAREGIHFTHAYSSTPTCTPARAALLTGLSPWRHGMLGYGKVAERYAFEKPRALGEAGYHTFAIGKCHFHPQRNLHGYDGALLDESGRQENADFISDYRRWFKSKAPDLDPDSTGIGWNDYRSRTYVLPEELHPTHWTGQMAVDFIRDYKRQEPFFLKVSFARPHSPYDPPKRFMEAYSEAEMPAPHVGEWAGRYAEPSRAGDVNLWHGDLGLQQARRSRRGYYGSVSFIDEQIGRILRVLEERGLLDDTLIVFTADHGDMLGDHHMWRKSYAYEASAKVPMLLRWPKSLGLQDRRGATCDRPVELRDVLPTFLDAAGHRSPSSLDGRSLLDLARDDDARWRDWIDLEHSVCYDRTNHWNALTDGRWKYIYHALDGSEQLFDLSQDPGELCDLATDSACSRALRGWRRRMVKHLSERGPHFVVGDELAVRTESLLYSPNFPSGKSGQYQGVVT